MKLKFKMYKIILICSIAVGLLFSNNVKVSAMEDDATPDQTAAYESYLNMSEKLNIRMDIQSENYPDNFGGCYIDGDKLVILLTENNDIIREYYQELCENSDVIEFKTVKYSYEELLQIEEEIIPELSEEYDIYEYYINVKSNKLDVGVSELKNDFQAYGITDEIYPVNFYEIEALPEATAMKGGEQISNTAASCSICFFGTYNGKKALVTCGHTNSVGRSIKYGSYNIGTVVKQNLRTFTDVDGTAASYGDFSIVDINDSTISGSQYVKTSSGSITVTGTANLIAGLSVSMYGKSSICVTGTVESTGVAVKFTDPEDYSTYKVKGLMTIKGTNTVTGGDSGGCVVYTTATGINRVGGCITGVKEGVYSYITPASYIESSGFSFN